MSNVLLIGSHIIGNSTASRRYKEVLDNIPSVNLTYISIEQQELDQVSLPTTLKKLQALSTYIVLRKKLNNIKVDDFDFVICMTVQPVLALSHLFSKAKIVCWYDSMPHHPEGGIAATLANSVAKFVYNRAFKRINILLPMSNWAKSQIAEYKFPNLISTFISPIYVSEDVWKRKANVDNDYPRKIRVLLSGNDAERKGFIGFFSWVIDSQADISGFEFTVLTNEGNPTFLELANILKINVVSHLTHDDLERIVEYYHHADIFFLPTKRDMMPNVLVEAAAAKLPILAANVGAINELIIPSKTGWLIEKEDWKGFYDRLINFKQNPHQITDENLTENSKKFFDSAMYNLLEKII